MPYCVQGRSDRLVAHSYAHVHAHMCTQLYDPYIAADRSSVTAGKLSFRGGSAIQSMPVPFLPLSKAEHREVPAMQIVVFGTLKW